MNGKCALCDFLFQSGVAFVFPNTLVMMMYPSTTEEWPHHMVSGFGTGFHDTNMPIFTLGATSPQAQCVSFTSEMVPLTMDRAPMSVPTVPVHLASLPESPEATKSSNLKFTLSPGCF